MELVEGDGGVGQARGDAFDEGRAHVDADFVDCLGVPAMRGEVVGERGDGVGIAALSGEQHPRLIDIDKQRDVVVAAPSGGLVDGNLSDVRGVNPRAPLSDVVVNHTPQPGVVLAYHPGHGLDRHGGDHGHQQRLKQKGEATVWPRPWHADRLDAAHIAADAWHAGVEIGLMLEEVEMAPGFPLGVVGRAIRRAATRTGKPATWGKVDLDVQPVCLGIEVGTGYRPRLGQP